MLDRETKSTVHKEVQTIIILTGALCGAAAEALPLFS
jgi:hypothetical protein